MNSTCVIPVHNEGTQSNTRAGVSAHCCHILVKGSLHCLWLRSISLRSGCDARVHHPHLGLCASFSHRFRDALQRAWSCIRDDRDSARQYTATPYLDIDHVQSAYKHTVIKAKVHESTRVIDGAYVPIAITYCQRNTVANTSRTAAPQDKWLLG